MSLLWDKYSKALLPGQFSEASRDHAKKLFPMGVQLLLKTWSLRNDTLVEKEAFIRHL
jgi:hypothetical protein